MKAYSSFPKPVIVDYLFQEIRPTGSPDVYSVISDRLYTEQPQDKNPAVFES